MKLESPKKQRTCKYLQKGSEGPQNQINSQQLQEELSIKTYMNELSDEIKIRIFKFVQFPLCLLLTCKRWYYISMDCQARGEWIVYSYGKAHALFHAIRLGPNFINVGVVQIIIAKDGIISRYFIQRLLMHFGSYDQTLLDMKRDYSSGLGNTDQAQNLQTTKLPWASDTPISVFTFLLNEASKKLKTLDLVAKGNDMELFHFLSAGPHIISQARQKLKNNFESLKELILHTKGVIQRLSELTELGFDLSHLVVLDILQLFEHRLNDIGKTIMDSFVKIRCRTEEAQSKFYTDLLTGAIDPERNMKTTNLWDFLRSYIGEKNEQDHFLKAMEYYYCKDIINLQENHVANETTSMICDTFKAYCQTYCYTKEFFLPSQLKIICKATSEDVLDPLFKCYLHMVFEIKPTSTTFDISPKIGDDINQDDKFKEENATLSHNQVSLTNEFSKTELPKQAETMTLQNETAAITEDIPRKGNNSKRKLQKQWYKELKKYHDRILNTQNKFDHYLKEFWQILVETEIGRELREKEKDIEKSSNPRVKNNRKLKQYNLGKHRKMSPNLARNRKMFEPVRKRNSRQLRSKVIK
ncbi:21136_t:CDS:2 [Cetraspora pellucida]|uniref:21136_t:CDS:1 n=1 Tax=Cetraspora pellucida TaxID=1433469 RepID=A0A9N8W2X0_9GLOM|nr:21136_t:CDS:2 [Cetraspora pellucida]